MHTHALECTLEMMPTIIQRQWKQSLEQIYKQLYSTGTHLSLYIPPLLYPALDLPPETDSWLWVEARQKEIGDRGEKGEVERET